MVQKINTKKGSYMITPKFYKNMVYKCSWGSARKYNVSGESMTCLCKKNNKNID